MNNLLILHAGLFRFAALSGAVAVAAGAFGAHALEGRVTDARLRVWGTAASYQLAHSLALIAAASHRSRIPGVLLATGITVFSGSLYLLVLTDRRWLGALTPIGGVGLIAGWAALALL